MMWLGLGLLVNPISMFLSWIPLLGDLSNAFNAITSFVSAFVISTVTVLVLSLGRHPLVLAGSVAVTLLVLLLGQKLLRTLRA